MYGVRLSFFSGGGRELYAMKVCIIIIRIICIL